MFFPLEGIQVLGSTRVCCCGGAAAAGFVYCAQSWFACISHFFYKERDDKGGDPLWVVGVWSRDGGSLLEGIQNCLSLCESESQACIFKICFSFVYSL